MTVNRIRQEAKKGDGIKQTYSHTLYREKKNANCVNYANICGSLEFPLWFGVWRLCFCILFVVSFILLNED